jgi:hypothetical protein
MTYLLITFLLVSHHIVSFAHSLTLSSTILKTTTEVMSFASQSATAVDNAIPASALRNVLSLSNNPQVVGAAWLVSSAFYTTYSTTKFLTYQQHNSVATTKKLDQDIGSRRHAPSLIQQLRIPRSTLLTLYRFGGSMLLGLFIYPDTHVIARIKDTLSHVSPFALPACFLFVANLANSISLKRIGISLTYTSKCAIPLMTVILTVLLDGTKALPHIYALLSLIPIAAGIAAASWNAPTFEVYGLTAAMVSATAQSALNVSSKRAMIRTGVQGVAAQRAMVTVGLVLTLVFTLMQSWYNQPHGTTTSSPTTSESTDTAPTSPPLWLSLAAVTAYHLEYVLSFLFVQLVQPITYGASDAMRRLAIILSGRWLFPGGPPLSTVNKAGMALALMGAASYSLATSLCK